MARSGEDEFLVAAMGITPSGATKFAARLAEAVAQAKIMHAGVELRLTASFGIAAASNFLPDKFGDFLWKLAAWCFYPLTPGIMVLGLLLRLLGVIHFPVIWIVMIPVQFIMFMLISMSTGLFVGGFVKTLIEAFDKPSR